MLHRDLLDESEPPEIRKGDLHWMLNEAAHRQAEILKPALCELVPIGSLRELPVGPEER